MDAYEPGDLCARCHRPMFDPPADLQFDHTDDRSGYLGLSHKACNLSAGGTLGARRRWGVKPVGWLKW